MSQGEWSASDQSRGCVRLGRAAGATATVEAVVTPVAVGQLAAPELRVHGLRPGLPPEQLGTITVRPMP